MTVKRREIEKKERNDEILKDYNDGMKMIDMVAKYRISSSRIYKIIGDHEKRE
ncbi:hypothetical protein LCGC14_0963610 [marine sediment metagenome]|uniref:Resolvase HTH domain-containing protein n=1 Tax=marine sediment metagenome TaxID=412755 RepID=A0A0F9RK91_9ZZZZ